MSQFQEGFTISGKAVSDLSTKQYFLVKHGTNAEEFILAAAATDKLIGVLQNKPKTGEEMSIKPVNTSGTGKVKLGGTVTKGAYLTSDANGKAVATTTAGNIVFGIAHEAGAADDVVEYLSIYIVHP